MIRNIFQFLILASLRIPLKSKTNRSDFNSFKANNKTS